MNDREKAHNKLLMTVKVCEQCGADIGLSKMLYYKCCFCYAEYTLDGRQIRPINKLHDGNKGGA